jgi:iron complex transport system substrate-binding protein
MRPRPLPALVGSLLVGSAVLAGCGNAAEPGTTAAGGSSAAAAQDFPVSIEHAFGSTEIEEEPQRVVTLGWSAQDIVYALGVTPVGMPAFTYGGGDDGVLPWDEDLYDPAATTLLDTTDGPPLEAIAALRPDVILAPYEGFDASVYADLSGIAPTVAYPGEAWTTPWREQTRIVGTALGRGGQAEELITGVEATLARTAAEHPEFSGVTFAYASMGTDAMSVYLPSDPRVQLLEDLGLVVAPSVGELAAGSDGNRFYTEVSLERVPDVSSDVLVGFTDGLGVADVATSPVYSRLPAVQRDAAVLIDDEAFAAAVSSVSVLSIPWSLEQLVGRLSTAAQRVPEA